MITREQFLRVMPQAVNRVDRFLAPLNATMDEFQINVPSRIAAYLAQLAHESAQFRYMREIASGEAYEGRADLGNTQPGDGKRFPGRGPIQITGRKNTGLASFALFGDDRLLANPELLEEPVTGCRSSGWFWTTGAGLNLSKRALAAGIPVGVNLNDLADALDFERITLAVNGGLNGLDDRRKYMAIAAQVVSMNTGVA